MHVRRLGIEVRHRQVVEFDEGLRVPLAPRLREGRLGDFPARHVTAGAFRKERIQLVRQGVLEEIHQKPYGPRKTQFALAGEIPRRIPVSGRELRII